jgi:hypothetical protein
MGLAKMASKLDILLNNTPIYLGSQGRRRDGLKVSV